MSAVLRFQNRPKRAGHHRAAVGVLASGAHSAGMSEAGHMVPEVEEFAPSHRLFSMFEHTPLPLLVDKDVRVSGWRQQAAFDDTRVGKWGAGPGVMNAGWVHGLRLDDLDVAPLWHAITHMVPSVVQSEEAVRRSARKDDIPVEQALESWRKRRELHTLECRELIAMFRGCPRVVIQGDFNCSPSYPDMDLFRDAGYAVHSPGVTHGDNGRIDLTVIKGVTLVDQDVLPKLGSDHSGIEAVVR